MRKGQIQTGYQIKHNFLCDVNAEEEKLGINI